MSSATHVAARLRRSRLTLLLALASAAYGCATTSPVDRGAAATGAVSSSNVPPISDSAVGAQVPAGWQEWLLHAGKRKTAYEIVAMDGTAVLRADGDRSASGVKTELDVDPGNSPILRFRWRVDHLIAGADLTDRHASDSPTRVAIAFDGDKSALPFRDQLQFEQAKILGGQEMPYATLMYVWDNKLPTESVVPNHYSQRIRKIVVASGEQGVGRWLEFQRNVVDDYRRAFGEDPGKIIGVVLMTDCDNTRERTRAYYGDVRFARY
jgi:hypothetical protein